jgi:hypothetical protein
MGISMNKKFALLLILMLAASCVTVVAHASIPQPSVPDFTLKFIDNSYDVPPTYSKDQYTGKTVMTQAGYHVENKSIEVTIKNQQFTPYKDAKGNYLDLYYDIRWKGHFGDYWYDYNSTRDYLVNSFSQFDDNGFPIPNSPFKVATFALGNNSQNSNYYSTIRDISAGGQADFQVQAFIGYYTRINLTITNPAELQFSHGEVPYYYSFSGESSGWSNTQTITIDGSASTTTPNTSPSQNSTGTPSQSGSENAASSSLDWAQIAALALLGVIAVLLVVAVVYLRRRSKVK